MNIHVDDAIFRLQANGGISRLWRELTPKLKRALPEATWDAQQRPDLFISTYYATAPIGVRSLVVCYDCIQSKYLHLRTDPVLADIQRAVADASAIVAISRETADDVMRFFGKPAVVAYCGGSERFQRASVAAQVAFQQQYGIDRPYVLMVGKRGLYKNAKALYQAWEFWAAANGHLVVVVGGEAPTADDLDFPRRHTEHLWLQLALSDTDLAAAYSGATAYVSPSLYEGFGLPIVEAMTCGCPVICGANGALSEVGGDTPFYCEPLLPRSLAAALDAACDPSARLTHILAGYAQAKRFTWARMADTVAGEIRKVCA